MRKHRHIKQGTRVTDVVPEAFLGIEFGSLVKRYNVRLISGCRWIVPTRSHQNLQPCIEVIGSLVGIWCIVPIYGTSYGAFDPPASSIKELQSASTDYNSCIHVSSVTVDAGLWKRTCSIMAVLRQNGVCRSSILLVCLDHNFKIISCLTSGEVRRLSTYSGEFDSRTGCQFMGD